MRTFSGPTAITDAVAALKQLVEARAVLIPGEAIRSMYRVFLDLEPVWTSMLVFNFTFTIGAPASDINDIGNNEQVNRRGAINQAKAYYMGVIPDELPLDGHFFITNNLDYSQRIEEEGSPLGYGQGALAYAAAGWAKHVKLGLQSALSKVPG